LELEKSVTPRSVPIAVVIDVTDDVRALGSGMLSMLVTDETSSCFEKKLKLIFFQQIFERILKWPFSRRLSFFVFIPHC
jgi:hypothetical protein